MQQFMRMFVLVCFIACSYTLEAQTQGKTQADTLKAKHSAKTHHVKDADIAAAVRNASTKDCGCGECAGKGCKPCHGKNCFYCVAKGLTTKECGCGMCDAKGCDDCGPGCDVCKFHLKVLDEEKKSSKEK